MRTCRVRGAQIGGEVEAKSAARVQASFAAVAAAPGAGARWLSLMGGRMSRLRLDELAAKIARAHARPTPAPRAELPTELQSVAGARPPPPPLRPTIPGGRPAKVVQNAKSVAGGRRTGDAEKGGDECSSI